MSFRILIITQIAFMSFVYNAEAGGMIRMQQNRAAQREAYIQAQRQQVIVQQQQAVYQQASRQVAIQRQKQMILQQRALQQQQLAYQMALRNGASASYLEPVGQHFEGGGSNFPQQHSETMGLSQIAKRLEASSEVWPLILDPNIKETLISQYIKWYEMQDVYIYKKPRHYVRLIDEFSTGNKSALQQPFKNLLKIAAIMEYDFNNGESKDVLAKKFLGEQFYKENKRRLGMP